MRRLLACVLLLGCGRAESAVPNAVLVVSQEQQASWVRNFNPLLPVGVSRWPAGGGIYEPLLIWNTVTETYVPWLATSYAWIDGATTLTVTLRDGVRWSDGQPLVAGDVVFTFDLLRRHRALDLHYVWGFLADIRATDARTVVFTFQRPYVPGLYYLGQQVIVPEHIWRDVADPVTFANPNPVATGPYTEVELFRNQVYQLGRNPNYWQPGKPAVRSLRFPALPSNDQANLALLHDEVDWAGNFLPAIDRIFVAPDKSHHHYWFPNVAGTIMLYANTARGPLADERVRKALSMAIDRDTLVAVAMYGYSHPADATGLSDAYQKWRDPEAASSDWVHFDPERAGRLLDEAGFVRGKDGWRHGLRWELVTVTGWSDWARVAQMVSRSLRSIGVEVTVRAYDFSAWFERLQRGTFELSLGWTLDGPTPYTMYRHLMSAETVLPLGAPAATNWGRFGIARADEILRAFERTADAAEQHELAKQLQREFARTAPAIPLYPNPAWGEASTRRFVGFPGPAAPYARLSPNVMPECLLVLTQVRPTGPLPAGQGGSQ
jgi:peptide/nickel transport system substrate-binding protein